jgi:hypothetical protein
MPDELRGRVSGKQGEYHILRANIKSILAQSRYIPGRPLLALTYRWPGLKDPVGFDTNLSIILLKQLTTNGRDLSH